MPPEAVAPGLILAAPASGAGKTVVTLSVLRAWRDAGLRVAPAKAGPDYIDPGFHAVAAGRDCRNLDCWAMRPAMLAGLVGACGRDADIILCEGVMGLFDGASDGAGSTADLAAATGWPVVLIVDARAQGASAAALVAGFARHRADITLAGVIFNRVGGAGHARILRESLAATLPEVKLCGMLPRDAALALPERHLGLVQASEHAALESFLDAASALAAAHVDLAALRDLARPARLARAGGPCAPILPPPILPPLGQRIAVARDAAFAFCYPAVLDGWRAAGATLSFFSPLADEGPGEDADAVYLPGGYPELHAGQLAANAHFRAALCCAAERGAAVYGECGGYMVLGHGLIDAAGRRCAMAGLLPLETSFAEPRLHLGYRRLRMTAPSPLGEAGARFMGHEFHYARVTAEGPGAALFTCTDARGENDGTAGLVAGRVAGSFIHLIDCAP